MRLIALWLTFAAILAACSPVASPSPTADLQATRAANSETMAAATLNAQPTATIEPTVTTSPTETPTPIQPTTTAEPTATKTLTPIPLNGQFLPLGIGDVPEGVFRIDNLTEYQISAFINGFTRPYRKPVYIAYKIDHFLVFRIPFGKYTFSVQIGDKKTLFGHFAIANKDKTTMKVYMDKVVIVGP